MAIANPLDNAQISGQIADLFGQIGAVKSWTKNTFKIGGVTITSFYDDTEHQHDEKMLAVDNAVMKVQSLGIGLPVSIKVYCTGSTNIGTLQMKNVAFPRGIGGEQDAAMVLSPKVLDRAWAAGLNGVCTTVGENTPAGLCTAIVVHEIGHLLHESEDDAAFWGEMPGFPDGLTPLDIYQSVSAYAATNTKELVAEVFLGRVFGKAYPPKIMDAYRALGGPAQAVLA